ncbi:restriction endonuclease subunit S [Corynebacterium sp. NML130628]|uniref:restriction endonuclease subunit S n=1 Tax=Corynebacterium sp. NML130628 TaxID=1906333 RepID=UPI0008FB01EF|nr:restriction endonuclease subunit S [Corynebacterium sp. NML130628]OIR41056.1 hypothetical protein BJP07_09435 [Corynebacterium sp. NML130628]
MVKSLKLSDATIKIGSGATPRGGKSAYVGSGTAFIRSQNVLDLEITLDGLAFIDEAAASKLAGVTVKQGDVLINITGDSTARVALWDLDMPARVNQHVSILRADPSLLNARWLQYWLVQPAVKNHLLVLASSGGSRPALTKTMLANLDVPLPPITQQNRIATVLGSLDAKIAANKHVVSASNELIRNLYRALPASRRTLNDVASLAKNNEQPHRFLPDKRLVGLEHFDPKSLWLPRSSAPETATSAKTEFQAGDTLFGKLRPYFHKVAIAPFDGYCSTDILVLRAKNPLHSPLVAAAANSDAVVQQAVNCSNGTRMPRAKWTDIEGHPIPDPDAPATLEFIGFAATLIQDATARLEENKALAKTRDELLPLLMNGKITVREAKQEAAAAGAEILNEENEA